MKGSVPIAYFSQTLPPNMDTSREIIGITGMEMPMRGSDTCHPTVERQQRLLHRGSDFHDSINCSGVRSFEKTRLKRTDKMAGSDPGRDYSPRYPAGFCAGYAARLSLESGDGLALREKTVSVQN